MRCAPLLLLVLASSCKPPEPGPPVCVPRSCSQLDVHCGTADDGCGGTLTCGTCSGTEQCVSGLCLCSPRTCGDLARSCGAANDGCGGRLDCGSCPAGRSCVSGACVCTPLTCSQARRQCGVTHDGCGAELDCGRCAPGRLCDTDFRCVPVVGSCFGARWCAERPFGGSSRLLAMSSGYDGLFVSGENGVMRRYREPGWNARAGTPSASSVAGLSDDELWTVYGKTVSRWNGAQWSTTTLTTPIGLMSIGVLSPTDVWVGGVAGTLDHFDGTRWSSVDGPIGGSSDVASIWAGSDGVAWAGGGHLLRKLKNGAVESRITVDAPIISIWGAAPNDVWAVSFAGPVFHFDGSSWSTSATPVQASWNSVYGTSARDVWVVGRGQNALHWDGTRWEAVPTGMQQFDTLHVVVGSVPHEVLLLGHYMMLKFDGQQLVGTSSAVPMPTGRWSSASGTLYVTGTGHTLFEWRNPVWDPVATPTRAAINSLSHRLGPGPPELLAVSDAGELMAYAPALSLRAVTQAPDAGLFGVFSAPTGDGWAVGDDGTVLQRAPGEAWTADHVTDGGVLPRLVGIWQGPDGRQYAAAADGRLYERDRSWRAAPSPPAKLSALWGFEDAGVWAVGAQGVILRREPAGWTRSPAPTTAQLHAIHGKSASDIWVVGDDSTVLHWDGVAWRRVDIGLPGLELAAVQATGSETVVASRDGLVIRYRPLRFK